MPSLECRHSSSEEDILSTDDLDSVDDPDAAPYEEYAITFDLPGETLYVLDALHLEIRLWSPCFCILFKMNFRCA